MTRDDRKILDDVLGEFDDGAFFGDLERADDEPAGVSDRFWAKVEQGECWIWQGATDRHGAGLFWKDGRMQLAKRVAFELLHGRPPVRDVGSTCGNRRCMRHLEEQ